MVTTMNLFDQPETPAPDFRGLDDGRVTLTLVYTTARDIKVLEP